MKRGQITQLAKATSVSVSMIAQIMRGEARPSLDLAEKLAAVTGTEPLVWMKRNPEAIEAAVAAAEKAESERLAKLSPMSSEALRLRGHGQSLFQTGQDKQ
ncbi:MAG: helix-turn-helix transcriptional regulator [Thermodesulfobacteriota bacterium]